MVFDDVDLSLYVMICSKYSSWSWNYVPLLSYFYSTSKLLQNQTVLSDYWINKMWKVVEYSCLWWSLHHWFKAWLNRHWHNHGERETGRESEIVLPHCQLLPTTHSTTATSPHFSVSIHHHHWQLHWHCYFRSFCFD